MVALPVAVLVAACAAAVIGAKLAAMHFLD